MPKQIDQDKLVVSPFVKVRREEGSIDIASENRSFQVSSVILSIVDQFSAPRTCDEAFQLCTKSESTLSHIKKGEFQSAVKSLQKKGILIVYPVTIGRRSYLPAVKLGIWSNPVCSIRILSSTDFSFNDRVEIGKFCSIADGVDIFLPSAGFNHSALNVTTFPIYQHYGVPPQKHWFKKNIEKKKTVIGNDVWIGTRAMIMAGISIGNGAIVGANSVVTKDVPDYAIVAGNPAQIVRYRFEPEIIQELLRIRWWDWSDSKIKHEIPNFYGDVNEFVQKHKRAARSLKAKSKKK